MKRVNLEEKRVYGMRIRTTNEKEMNPETAQIGALWGKYFEKIFPTLTPEIKSYGVYSNYESDASGAFDVTVSIDEKREDLEMLTLEAGAYLCFETKGELPQAVIDTWGEIWHYFANENCTDKRAFKTDFELYLSESEAAIYIGIE